MNAIIGMSELAVREYGKPAGLNFIAEIRQAGTNLLSIINDILDFSKIEAGSLQINQALYETVSLLNDVMTIIQGQGNTALLRFIVEDSGIGIKPEDIRRLFGDFERVDMERNTGIEGAGLGLSRARSLCRAMGGDISVESEYGKGSVFTAVMLQSFDCGCKLIENIDEKNPANTRNVSVSFIAPGFRVLVVDDIKVNLKIAKGLLAPFEMDVDTCPSGEAALSMVRENEYDLIFMDHMMPEMDGIETTAAIRAMDGEYFKTVPIIALTANAISGMREMFFENGFNDFLSKPIEIRRLYELMDRCIPRDRKVKSERRAYNSGFQPKTGMEIEGLNTPRGLASTGGTVAGYIKVLETHCRDAEKRLKILSDAPDENNLSPFTTQVHALKSASASIGAEEISCLAAELEEAGKNCDTEFIRANLDAFLEKLTAATERIKTVISKKQAISPDGKRQNMGESLNLLKSALASENIGNVDKILASLTGEALDEAARDCLSRISDLVLVGEFEEALKMTESLER
jgi:CheY-like chemotaxis protein